MIKQVKRRYFLLRIDSTEPLEDDDVKDAVWTAVVRLFGEYGASQVGLFLVQFDKEKKEAVLRCSHKALDLVHASVSSISKIRDKPVTVHVLKISGTMKGLSRKHH